MGNGYWIWLPQSKRTGYGSGNLQNPAVLPGLNAESPCCRSSQGLVSVCSEHFQGTGQSITNAGWNVDGFVWMNVHGLSGIRNNGAFSMADVDGLESFGSFEFHRFVCHDFFNPEIRCFQFREVFHNTGSVVSGVVNDIQGFFNAPLSMYSSICEKLTIQP